MELLRKFIHLAKPKNKSTAVKTTTTTAEFQVLSDLHLEVGKQYSDFAFPATAPYLILAGDIGRLADYELYLGFLARTVQSYRRVFLVLGNHEFYGLTYEEGVSAAVRMETEESLEGKMTLLHRKRWDLNDLCLDRIATEVDEKSTTTPTVVILDAPCGSAIPDEKRDLVQAKISDFRQIHGGWSAAQHNQIHTEEVAWLREQTANLRTQLATPAIVVVVTHHAPTLRGTSKPHQESNPWTVAFATELFDNESSNNADLWPGVALWVFGHTHHSADMARRGIRVVANQRGYVLGGKSLDGTDGFDPGKVIAV